MARVNPIPEGCHSVQPYMMFAGCEKAMEFYTKAFGAREVFRFKGPDGKVGHAEMQIGDCHIMMADESPQMEDRLKAQIASRERGGSRIFEPRHMADRIQHHASTRPAARSGSAPWRK